MMNFTPFGNHFTSMHQFSAAGKPSSGQSNTILVPSTTTSPHYHHSTIDNHVNYSNNNHIVSTAIIPSQHHHQDIRHLMNQNNLAHPPTTSQSNWVDLGLNRTNNESIKSSLNIPTYSIQASTANSTHTIQWPLRTVTTQNVSTMTDLEKPENLCKTGSKDQGFSDDSDDSSKSSIADNRHNFVRDNCSKIHLKNQGNVMAEYLARLQPSSIPLGIQQFLQRHNIKVTQDSGVSNKKRNLESKLKSSEIRISTALDGSTLFCCPECHMAYARKDLLEQHITIHKAERKFECNVCGVCLKRKEHLDQHKRGHSEERPFICVICCKGFKRNEHLRRHIVIHSGDKTHACNECGKAFSRKDHLNKHAQIHIAKRVKSEIDDNCPPSVLHMEPSQLLSA